jgi:cysteine-rich repeat protein
MPTCTAITGACGDFFMQANEACDDRVNDGAYGGCTSSCTLAVTVRRRNGLRG